MNPRAVTVRIAIALLLAAAISGCASTSNNPQDPFEGYNRAMFTFNDNVDQVTLKPAAKLYRTILPKFVQTGVSNFFGNIGDVWIAANNLMQGKLEDGMSDVARVMINSSVGLVGVLDIASEAGLTKHNEDFGQTLGKWGFKSGPYVVLPFIGSSTVRDTIGSGVDVFAGDLWGYVTPVSVRNWGYGIRYVERRTSILDAGALLEDAALDKYEFVRDAYLQRRESQVNDNRANETKPNYQDSIQTR
jgi:phospholipid-binding lipoprotein MlaA